MHTRDWGHIDWEQVQELFLAAADLPPQAQARFLAEACPGDSDLRRKVESLLVSDRKRGESIASAVEHTAQVLFEEKSLIGARLGAYRVLREIGRGGMGAVYLGTRDDDQYQRYVAIKVVKHGMDTDEVLERFRHERRILASLDHPYIARLLDGGTAPDGRPFFVMEYVAGQPIDSYCKQHQLDIRARCRLFLKVCEAVSHAHGKLVVHRDLKPGNIFIAPDGAPKLLDFGVAKLLNPGTSQDATVTAIQMQPLTLHYASPEQIRGLAVNTTTDVYSLGAVLYELLTGLKAQQFKSSTPEEVERVICITEVSRPSTALGANSELPDSWRRQLSGDLDNIVLMAMSKEPGRRYLSVEQFSADVHRYLNGWPVTARAGDFAYRAGKYLRRNRTSIAAAVIIGAALLGGAAAATFQAVRAGREQVRAEMERQRALESQVRAETSQRNADTQRQYAEAQRREADLQRLAADTQRQLADRRFEQVRQLAGTFLFEFHDAIAKLPGSTPERKMVIETGLRYYDMLVKDAGQNQQLLEEIARGYDRLGDVQGNPYFANLGDAPAAAVSYGKALSVRQRVSDPSGEFLRDRIRGHVKLAQVMMAQGDLKAGERYLQQALVFGQQGPAAKSYEARDALANAYSSFGDLKIRKALHAEAVEPYLRLLDLSTQLAAESHDKPEAQSGLALAHTKLGDVYCALERSAEALDHLLIALEIDQRLATADPNSLPRTRSLYIVNSMLARVLRSRTGLSLGKPGEERNYLQAASDLADKMAAVDPGNRRGLIDIALASDGLGDWLKKENDLQPAIRAYRKALTAAERVSQLSTQTSGNEDLLLQAHERLASGLALDAKYEEALEHLRKADEYLGMAEKQNPGLARNLLRKAEILNERAKVFAAQKRWEQAIPAFAEIIGIFESQRKVDSTNQVYLNEQADLYTRLADCYAAAGKRDAAIHAVRAALDRIREIEAGRALVKEEEDDRKANVAKLAAWEKR